MEEGEGVEKLGRKNFVKKNGGSLSIHILKKKKKKEGE
jgi:hypothetical protein